MERCFLSQTRISPFREHGGRIQTWRIGESPMCLENGTFKGGTDRYYSMVGWPATILLFPARASMLVLGRRGSAQVVWLRTVCLDNFYG